MLTLWTVVALILLTVWIGLARETRLALLGYILQILCILTLYGMKIFPMGDPWLWAGWAAMVVIRLFGVPLILWRYLGEDWWTERVMHDLVNPWGAVVAYGFLAVVGFFTGSRSGSSMVGAALSMFLLGVGIVLFKHDPSKQVFGLLSADNAADLMIVAALSKMTLDAELGIYGSVLLAVLCLVLLIRWLQHRTRERSTRKLVQLRG